MNFKTHHFGLTITRNGDWILYLEIGATSVNLHSCNSNYRRILKTLHYDREFGYCFFNIINGITGKYLEFNIGYNKTYLQTNLFNLKGELK